MNSHLPGVNRTIEVIIRENMEAITKNAIQMPFQFLSSSSVANSYVREQKKSGNIMNFMRFMIFMIH